MALIDTYRSNIIRKKTELAKLSADRAKETDKKAKLTTKINNASKALKSTKSPSTIKSKLSEIERAEKDSAAIDKKIAEIDGKIAKKESEIASEEKKYRTEEEKIRTKQEREDLQRRRDNEKTLKQINNVVEAQQRQQREMQLEIENLKNVPETISVLFLATNPIDSDRLRLDAEARSIQEMIRKSEHRDSIKFETRWAVRPLDILQAINEVNPDVVHFSGHGADTGELVLENTDGTARFVSAESITQAIMAASDRIHLLFFNACFSCEQAQSVTQCVDAAIGMTDSISDDAACVFAAQFYSAIGFGHSVKRAYDQAIAALTLEVPIEAGTPSIYCKDGINLDTLYLVKPQN